MFALMHNKIEHFGIEARTVFSIYNNCLYGRKYKPLFLILED